MSGDPKVGVVTEYENPNIKSSLKLQELVKGTAKKLQKQIDDNPNYIESLKNSKYDVMIELQSLVEESEK